MCPNESYNKFIKLYTELFEKTFPLREYKHNSKHLKKEPWFTAGLLTSSKKKKKLFSQKLSNPTENNILKYKKFNKIYNKLKRNMKLNYYKNVLNENRFNIKKTWSILRQAMGKTNDKSNYPNSFGIIDILI